MPRGYGYGGGFANPYQGLGQGIQNAADSIADAIKEQRKAQEQATGAQILADQALKAQAITPEQYAKFVNSSATQKAAMTGAFLHSMAAQNQQSEQLQRDREYAMRIRNYNNQWQQQQDQQNLYDQGPGAGVKWFNGQAYRWNGAEWLPLPATLSQGTPSVQQELQDKTGLQPQDILSGIQYTQTAVPGVTGGTPAEQAPPVFTGGTESGFFDKKTGIFQPATSGDQLAKASHVRVQGTVMPMSDYASYYRRLKQQPVQPNVATAGGAASNVAPGYGVQAVRMRAPDGTVSAVDPQLVDHFKSLGAVVVP
jgi:hypothetical protein